MVTTLSAFIKERRGRRGWSQSRLAEEAGTSPAYVSQLESGRVNLPSADLRRRLAAALGVTHLDVLVAAGELTQSEAGQTAHPAAVRPDRVKARYLDLLHQLDMTPEAVLVLEANLPALVRYQGKKPIPAVGAGEDAATPAVLPEGAGTPNGTPAPRRGG